MAYCLYYRPFGQQSPVAIDSGDAGNEQAGEGLGIESRNGLSVRLRICLASLFGWPLLASDFTTAIGLYTRKGPDWRQLSRGRNLPSVRQSAPFPT